MSRIAHRIFHCLPLALACALIVAIFLRAMAGLDLSWDAIAYHTPFIAFRMGFISPEQFQMWNGQSVYFDGFPPLFDYVRGGLWYLAGRPEAANLLALLSLLAVVFYVRARYAVSPAWSVIGLLAIPAVQTAASLNYTDLAANCFLLIVVLSVCEVWIDRSRLTSKSWWLIFTVSAFMAANSKLHISVLTFIAVAFCAVAIALELRRRRAGWAQWLGFGVLAAAFCAGIGYHLIWNTIEFANPVYPVNIVIGPLHLVGPYTNAEYYLPPYLKNTPQPIRWFLSMIEYRALELRPIPYMSGMGDVPESVHSSRMGGFFGFLAVFSIAFFIYNAVRVKTATSKTMLGAFCVITVIVSVMFSSHESRYYLVWMMFLIIANLVLLREESLREAAWTYRLVLLCSLLFVSSVTGFFYLLPQRDWASLHIVEAHTQLERTVRAGETYCANDWKQIGFLLAPIFHPDIAKERPYNIRVGDCSGLVSIPRS